uniref:AB hydrolase-1 domain-containing protein n=1 Tax=Stomoxys calcitrans TaxID=35570 RepID=A0A1I8P6H0_STOCA
MMHCWQCSSDIWVLNGPDNGLAFMLADAGYDVWLGNARGNFYCEQHLTMSPMTEAFWEFSIDEIGQIDVPTKIDYILKVVNQTKLHYVGFSQGTSALLIALSTKPLYNQKLRSTHLLAPSVFFCHVKTPAIQALYSILGSPNIVSRLFGTLPFQEIFALFRSFAIRFCSIATNLDLCINALGILTGPYSPYMNRTLFVDLLDTVPAGGSNRQVNHIMQSALSCGFSSYDFGYQRNMQKYGNPLPPAYQLKNISTATPIDMYFADNDSLVSVADTQQLFKIMGSKAAWHRIKYRKFGHMDFVLASNVKVCINDCILAKMQSYEGRAFKGGLCKCFRNKPF